MPNQTDNHIIEEIKERIDIVSLISRYIEVKQAGKNFSARCPFHAEKTPSFMISPDIQRYKCFGCQKGGDIFTFVMDYEHIDFVEALEKLAKEAGVQLPKFNKPVNKIYAILEMINRLACEFFTKQLNEPQGKIALDYLLNRGITKEAIKTFEIGYAVGDNTLLSYLLSKADFTKEQLLQSGLFVEKNPTYTQTRAYPNKTSVNISPEASQSRLASEKTNLSRNSKPANSNASDKNTLIQEIKDKFAKRVMFPIHNEKGKVIAFSGRILPGNDYGPKYLNSPETPIFHKRNAIFGLYHAKNEIRKANLCILCEGQIDMISTYMAGVRNIVAPQGTALTEDQLNLIKKYTENLLLIFDTDSAGQAAVEKGFIISTKLGFNTFATNTGDYKDIDELIQKDRSRLEKMIESKQDAFTYLLSNRIAKMDVSKLADYKAILGYVEELLQNVVDESSRSFFIEKAEKITGIGKENFAKSAKEKRYGREDNYGQGQDSSLDDGYFNKMDGRAGETYYNNHVGARQNAQRLSLESQFIGTIISHSKYDYFNDLIKSEKAWDQYFTKPTVLKIAQFIVNLDSKKTREYKEKPEKSSLFKDIVTQYPDDTSIPKFFEAITFDKSIIGNVELEDKELNQMFARLKKNFSASRVRRLRQLIGVEEEKDSPDNDLIAGYFAEIEDLVGKGSGK